MPPFQTAEYLSAGGNRNSAAADWSVNANVLAFGADQNIALWRPLNDDQLGVFSLLKGHTAKVTAVCFSHPHGSNEILVSGDADGNVKTYQVGKNGNSHYIGQANAHAGAVNCISCLGQSDIFISGGFDTTIKIWKRRDDGLSLMSTINTSPRFIPLSLSICKFVERKAGDSAFIAAGGTRNDIQIYSVNQISTELKIHHCASLKGHEGWIRSLALTLRRDGCYILASASADKYVRLWKFSPGEEVSIKSIADVSETGISQITLTPKLQTVSSSDAEYTITFEALLLGHEDWVYSASWNPVPGTLQLLTASADGSLTIWEPDPGSGVWYSASRLGEISGQKGATTATGSSGGFWTGLWSPDAKTVMCLGRTGSWRLWTYGEDSQYWVLKSAIGGHIASVNDIAWSTDGSYLLSTSSDQTTRLHAEWKRGTKRTWHEFARPQIHGYDLNCLSSTGETQFVSGADEKLLRVFDEPKAIAKLLQDLCEINLHEDDLLPDTAAIPVLGLSNKPLDDGTESERNGAALESTTNGSGSSFNPLTAPPTEDVLSRHTLFPEHEKLYGHGYEISTSAASSQFNILATACKASSLDHAVIRLYDTKDWHEIKPPLSAHTLTVTRLAWSLHPEPYLLSVGRDRQWTVFKYNSETKSWSLKQSNPKAHTRMILDCVWSPKGGHLFFATAGRDKSIKIWSRPRFDLDGSFANDGEFSLATEIKRKNAVTAVDFTCDVHEKHALLAAGEEDGTISVHVIDVNDPSSIIRSLELDPSLFPSKTVNRLAWRPNYIRSGGDSRTVQLAVASADSSVRILRLNIAELCSSHGEVLLERFTEKEQLGSDFRR